MAEALGNTSKVLESWLDRPIGFASFPGQDDVFILPETWFRQRHISAPICRPLVLGEIVRDWFEHCNEDALVPYERDQNPIALDLDTRWGRHLWSMRRLLSSTTGFGGTTRAESTDPWWTWYRWVPSRYKTPLTISFAFVATHNHFALDRGGKVFNRSAPVIKLRESASEDDHLALLGLLNSSAACFWLKQVSHNKGRPGAEQAGADEPWEHRYEFTGTKLQEFPVPERLPVALGRKIDEYARYLAELEPAAICNRSTPSRSTLSAASRAHGATRSRMIALQEELDWNVYESYGLLSDAEISDVVSMDPDSVPEISSSERAFAIALARRVADQDTQTTWFTHHNHKFALTTDIPEHWPGWYRDVVQARIDTIGEAARHRAH